MIVLNASSIVAELVKLEDQGSYYFEGEGACGIKWVSGEKRGRVCERAHLLERLRAWKKYSYYFFCTPILGVVLSHLLMTDWQNLGKPWGLLWMMLRIYSKNKLIKFLAVVQSFKICSLETFVHQFLYSELNIINNLKELKLVGRKHFINWSITIGNYYKLICINEL